MGYYWGFDKMLNVHIFMRDCFEVKQIEEHQRGGPSKGKTINKQALVVKVMQPSWDLILHFRKNLSPLQCLNKKVRYADRYPHRISTG